MSHQMKVTTQIKNLSVLKETLEELGYSSQEQGVLNDYQNNAIGKIDLTVSLGDKKNRVGFKKNAEEMYDLVGDFYGTNVQENTFKTSVVKTYMNKQVKALLKKKRYTVVNEQVDAQGWTVIRGRSMAA